MIGNEEIKLVSGLFTFLSEKPVIFDIGSNKGDWSDIMLKEYGDECTIYMFEPNPKLLSYTEIKYEYKKNIIFNELAAYQYNGEYDFYYFENFNNELSSLLKQDWWEAELPMKTKKVQTIRIDKYCKEKGIDFIDYLKIDCEGADYDVLLGCAEMINKDKIRFIQIEYGGHYKLKGRKFERIISMVNDLGYKVYSYDEKTDNYNEVSRGTFHEDYHYENYIITKEEIHNYSMDGGWLMAFRESVKDLPKFNFVMEVGSYEGLTAKYMCENMIEDGGRMIVVDPLKDYYTKEDDHNAYPYFKQQYQRWKRNTRGLPIELFRDDSRSVLPRFSAFRFSFIFVDGNHEEDVVYIDLVNCFPILKKDGFLLIDDYNIYTVETKRGIDKFLKEYDGRYDIVKEGYQLLIKKICD
jgi:FkbM family methyltransferase